MEFFAVITNPRRVQQARSPQEARTEVEKYVHSSIRKIHPGADILNRVLTLLEQHPNISRQDIFDLFLAATMLENGITRIYSYNQDHFTRFLELTVLTP
jgi:predicted nucleic acid-binding protein